LKDKNESVVSFQHTTKGLDLNKTNSNRETNAKSLIERETFLLQDSKKFTI